MAYTDIHRSMKENVARLEDIAVRCQLHFPQSTKLCPMIEDRYLSAIKSNRDPTGLDPSTDEEIGKLFASSISRNLKAREPDLDVLLAPSNPQTQANDSHTPARRACEPCAKKKIGCGKQKPICVQCRMLQSTGDSKHTSYYPGLEWRYYASMFPPATIGSLSPSLMLT